MAKQLTTKEKKKLKIPYSHDKISQQEQHNHNIIWHNWRL